MTEVRINTAEIEQHAANFAKLVGETYAAAVRTAYAAAMTEAQQRLGEVENARNAATQELAGLTSQIKTAKKQLAEAAAESGDRQELVATLKAQTETLEAKVAAAERKLATVQAAIHDAVA